MMVGIGAVGDLRPHHHWSTHLSNIHTKTLKTVKHHVPSMRFFISNLANKCIYQNICVYIFVYIYSTYSILQFICFFPLRRVAGPCHAINCNKVRLARCESLCILYWRFRKHLVACQGCCNQGVRDSIDMMRIYQMYKSHQELSKHNLKTMPIFT